LIGKPGTTVRQIPLSSDFGNTVVFVSDRQLAYPYGREVAGYGVADLTQTIVKAHAAGATVLVQPFTMGNTTTAMVQFAGGYIAELHTA